MNSKTRDNLKIVGCDVSLPIRFLLKVYLDATVYAVMWLKSTTQSSSTMCWCDKRLCFYYWTTTIYSNVNELHYGIPILTDSNSLSRAQHARSGAQHMQNGERALSVLKKHTTRFVRVLFRTRRQGKKNIRKTLSQTGHATIVRLPICGMSKELHIPPLIWP